MPGWIPSVSQHFMWSALAVLVYVLSTRARGERRAPAAAIAWVMGLALLPYLMLPLYIAFGRRKQRAPRNSRVPHSTEYAHWAAALLGGFGLRPPTRAEVRFHADGAESLEALWTHIASARERLDVCMFLIGDDPVGREALKRLADQARNGIKVRLLLDGFGGKTAPRGPLQALRAAGGQVSAFGPLLAWPSSGPPNLRNHRKLIIADGVRMWAGGRNLAIEYFQEHDGAAPWIDLTFDLTGAVAAVAALQFECDWDRRRKPTEQTVPAVEIDSAGYAQFLPSGPDQPEDTAQALIVDACFRAQNRLLAVSPYFVPDDALRTGLRLAARRGVRVTLVLPAVSNHPLADFARTRAMRELSDAGADIRLVPTMVHAKAIVIDDTLALSGSINLDSRSLLLNYESEVVFYGTGEIAWLTKWIEALATRGRPFAARPPGLLRDLAEGLILAIAFQL